MGCRARCCDAEWPFHSRELQRSHVPQKPRNPPCSELTMQVNVEYRGKSFVDHGSKPEMSGQLPDLGSWSSGFVFVQEAAGTQERACLASQTGREKHARMIHLEHYPVSNIRHLRFFHRHHAVIGFRQP